jgi:hypothetical protein
MMMMMVRAGGRGVGRENMMILLYTIFTGMAALVDT